MLLKILLCFAIDKFTSNILFSKECFTKFQFMRRLVEQKVQNSMKDFVSLKKVLC